MKSVKLFLFIILIKAFFFIGCNDFYHDLSLNFNKRDLFDSKITSFSFHPDENPNIDAEIEGRINHKTNKIFIIAPAGTGISGMKINPRFTSSGIVYVKGKIQKSGSNRHMYNNPLKYEVISANEVNRKVYTVTVLEHDSKIFVNHLSSGGGNGSSWDNAFNSLREAAELASLFPDKKMKEIWIAAGTYKPDGIDNYFLLSANTSFIGGFAGNESDVNARDISANKTIISGNLGNGQFSGNLFGIFDENISNIIEKDITFDGIEFTDANSSAEEGVRKHGAAINAFLSSDAALKIVNCEFTNLSGGAVFALDGNTIIINTSFQNITANDNFGAVHISGERADITNSNFLDIEGSALSIFGSIINISDTGFKNITCTGNQALYVTASEYVIIKNSTIDNVVSGRGIYATSYKSLLITDSSITNCEITGHGGGIYLNNFGRAEISFITLNNVAADIGSGIYYIGINDTYNSSLLLMNILISGAYIYDYPHPQMHLIGNNISISVQ